MTLLRAIKVEFFANAQIWHTAAAKPRRRPFMKLQYIGSRKGCSCFRRASGFKRQILLSIRIYEFLTFDLGVKLGKKSFLSFVESIETVL